MESILICNLHDNYSTLLIKFGCTLYIEIKINQYINNLAEQVSYDARYKWRKNTLKLVLENPEFPRQCLVREKQDSCAHRENNFDWKWDLYVARKDALLRHICCEK